MANGLKDTWPGFCPNADIKIKEGKFTHDNLIAHQAVAMTLGEHKGLMVAAAIVQQILEEENVHESPETAKRYSECIHSDTVIIDDGDQTLVCKHSKGA